MYDSYPSVLFGIFQAPMPLQLFLDLGRSRSARSCRLNHSTESVSHCPHQCLRSARRQCVLGICVTLVVEPGPVDEEGDVLWEVEAAGDENHGENDEYAGV